MTAFDLATIGDDLASSLEEFNRLPEPDEVDGVYARAMQATWRVLRRRGFVRLLADADQAWVLANIEESASLRCYLLLRAAGRQSEPELAGPCRVSDLGPYFDPLPAGRLNVMPRDFDAWFLATAFGDTGSASTASVSPWRSVPSRAATPWAAILPCWPRAMMARAGAASSARPRTDRRCSMARIRAKRSPAATTREPRTMEAAQAAYRNRKEQVWDKGKEKLRKALKASKGHSPARLGGLGQYSRSGHYRAYGLVYIEKHSRNTVYNLPAEVLGRRLAALGRGSQEVAAGSAEHGARYRLDYERPCRGGAQQNFLWGFLPYDNQAHHIIPKEAFDLAFDREQMRILERVPYDLNHGENIILLPKRKRERFIHRLVNHSGCHPTYSNLVVSDMQKTRQILEDFACEAPNPPLASVLRQLIELQGRYWT